MNQQADNGKSIEALNTDTAPGDAQSSPLGPDIFLVDLLNEMEAFGFSFGLTLTIQGFLISGTPIFYNEFLERQGRLIQHTFEENAEEAPTRDRADALIRLGRAIRLKYNREADEYKIPDVPDGDADAWRRRDEAQKEILNAPRENIILKDVTMLAPSGEQVDIPIWRGRLNHVAGWSFGRLQKWEYDGIDLDSLSLTDPSIDDLSTQ